MENAVVWRTCGFEGVSKVRAEDERGGQSQRGGAREATVPRDMREEKADESAADASARLRVELDNTRGLERLVPTP